MPKKEQGGVPAPENAHNPKGEPVYVRASHFIDGLAAEQTYMDVRHTLRTTQKKGEGWNVAAYHLTSQEDVSWYVAVAGQQPPEVLEEKLSTALAAGVQAPLPEKFHDLLTGYHQETAESTMTVDEWLAADEQRDAV